MKAQLGEARSKSFIADAPSARHTLAARLPEVPLMGLMIVVFVVGFIVFLGAIIAMQPAGFRIERTTIIAAPPAEVFGQINDLHRFQDWSPWAKLDPGCKVTFDGPQEGIGSSFHWSGNNKVGEGTMTIIESRPSELVKATLEFLRPFKATNMAEFAFQPVDNGTKMTWSMTGNRNFVMKGFSLFMNMDKLVGGDFEKGLATLKTLCESTPKGAA
jgi:hypothetical protein